MALPPPGSGGGIAGEGPPGSSEVKVARDWQITTLPQPLNDRSFEPRYPALAKRQGREARVIVELSIDASGAVASAKVLDGPTRHGFREAALEYVKKLRFAPARAGAHEVASRIEWTVHFYVRN
jgi:protein TonB